MDDTRTPLERIESAVDRATIEMQVLRAERDRARAAIEAQAAMLRECVGIAQSMLSAMIEDFGDPNDFPTDDGSVAAGIDSQSFNTFKMMRDWRATLAKAEEMLR